MTNPDENHLIQYTASGSIKKNKNLSLGNDALSNSILNGDKSTENITSNQNIDHNLLSM